MLNMSRLTFCKLGCIMKFVRWYVLFLELYYKKHLPLTVFHWVFWLIISYFPTEKSIKLSCCYDLKKDCKNCLTICSRKKDKKLETNDKIFFFLIYFPHNFVTKKKLILIIHFMHERCQSIRLTRQTLNLHLGGL